MVSCDLDLVLVGLATAMGGLGCRLDGRHWARSGGHQVVTYAFGDKHCLRNYTLQDCGLFLDVTANRP